MKLYSDRNNIQVELIRLRKNIDFIAVETFQVGQQFMKLGSLSIREVSPPFTLRSNQLFSFIAFPANTERRQLCNSTVNRYRWI